MEVDRKRKERLKTERMTEVKKMADKMLNMAWKNMRNRKADQVALQSQLACACRECTQEKEWIGEGVDICEIGG